MFEESRGPVTLKTKNKKNLPKNTVCLRISSLKLIELQDSYR